MLAKRLDTVQEYYFSQKLREIDTMNKAGKAIINLGIGSPDLAPHTSVVETLHAESLKVNQHAYQSYMGTPLLREAIATWYKKWYDVSLDADKEVLPLIGSKEGIMHICMTYLNEGDAVLIPNPGYPTYSSAAAIAGADVITYDLLEENNWLPDINSMRKSIEGKKVKLLFINYPHMPTGALPTVDILQQIILFAKVNDILIVNDNPYSFILNKEPISILSLDGAKEVCLELNSLSKSHNMAGWRVGMLLGAAERISEVLRFKSNMDSGMFLPLQLAAAKALELDQSWFDYINSIYRVRQQKAFDLLDLLECKYDKNQVGMFVWAKIPASQKDGFALSDLVLFKSNVFITPGGIFGSNGNRYIRVSLCATEEKFELAIKRVKEGLCV